MDEVLSRRDPCGQSGGRGRLEITDHDVNNGSVSDTSREVVEAEALKAAMKANEEVAIEFTTEATDSAIATRGTAL